MKKALFTALFVAFATTVTFASHIVGGFISYTHTGNNDYLIVMKLFRDCEGITGPSQANICISSATLASNMTCMLMLDTVIQIASNTCVAQGLTWCQGGTAFGVEEYTLSGTINIPPATDWMLSYWDCCRNGALATVVPNSYHIYSTLDNSLAPNSSPIFNNTIFNEYCAGNYTMVDYSCYDIDGDSLVYRLDSCLQSASTCPDSGIISVDYLPGYDYINFTTSFTPISMNSFNGVISCTPTQIQIAVLSVLIDEYRNGVKIGTMKRDDEIVISSGMQNPDSITGMIFLDVNNNQVMDTLEPPIIGRLVEVQPGNVIETTGADGKYAAHLIPGTFSVTIPNPPLYTTVTPASHSATFIAVGEHDSLNDFAFYPAPGITDLRVTITSTPATPDINCNYWVNVENVGTTVASGMLDFTLDPLSSFISAVPPINSQTGQVLNFTVPVLFPWTSITYHVVAKTDSSAAIGDTLFHTATATPIVSDTTPGDNTCDLHQPVVLSYDPNFKAVEPAGDITPSFVQQGDWLEYTIHFQNTGNGPAAFVSLKDGLDANLQTGTLEKIASSHLCNYHVSGQGLLEVNFPAINLPTIGTNEPGSHGFFKYRIRPLTTLDPGAQIINAANIYFDSNPAITTNTVITPVSGITVIEDVANADIQAVFYPNPSSDVINISTTRQQLSLIVMDVTGRLMYNATFSGQNSFTMHDWADGIYIYRLFTKDGKHASGRLIKQ